LQNKRGSGNRPPPREKERESLGHREMSSVKDAWTHDIPRTERSHEFDLWFNWPSFLFFLFRIGVMWEARHKPRPIGAISVRYTTIKAVDLHRDLLLNQDPDSFRRTVCSVILKGVT
jgi:hypothetical protein